jgi:hypothetical protein
MTIGLGIAAVHAAVMGFLWLPIDAQQSVLQSDPTQLRHGVELAKRAMEASFGTDASLHHRVSSPPLEQRQQADGESNEEEEVSMAQAALVMSRR